MILKNKKILITGGSSGIGKAIAIECAKKGGKIVVHYRNNKKGAIETLKEIQKYSNGIIVSADLTQVSEIKNMFEKLEMMNYRDLEILVNNAGEAKTGEFDDLDTWESQWSNIFMSQVYVTNAFIKSYRIKGIRKIVNISSIYAFPEMGNSDFPQYSAAKAAVNSFTCNLAKKLSPSILVNAVSPGYVWTPAWEGTSKEELDACKSLTKINRFIEPIEIATTVIELLQNDAITGEIIRIDGGLHLNRIF